MTGVNAKLQLCLRKLISVRGWKFRVRQLKITSYQRSHQIQPHKCPELVEANQMEKFSDSQWILMTCKHLFNLHSWLLLLHFFLAKRGVYPCTCISTALVRSFSSLYNSNIHVTFLVNTFCFFSTAFIACHWTSTALLPHLYVYPWSANFSSLSSPAYQPWRII